VAVVLEIHDISLQISQEQCIIHIDPVIVIVAVPDTNIHGHDGTVS